MNYPVFSSCEFLKNIKQFAQKESKACSDKALASILDEIAKIAQFHNWSMLHKKLSSSETVPLDICITINKSLPKIIPSVIVDYVYLEVKQYLNRHYLQFEFDVNSSNFEPHIDSHCERIDINQEVIDAFRCYSHELLNDVIKRLNLKYYWCIDFHALPDIYG
jgi:hypothetical protein